MNTCRTRIGGNGGRRSGNNDKCKSARRVKVGVKRRLIILLWSVWFAYLAVMSEYSGGGAGVAASSDSNPGSRSQAGESGGMQEGKILFRDGIPMATDTIDGVGQNFVEAGEGWAGRYRRETPRTGRMEEDEFERILRAGEDNLVPGFNCTPPAILDFPQDLFTQTERRAGAVIVHFLVSLYVFYSLAIVCDDYFVPSIETICGELKLPSDVAGATFMAVATSSPELFTNVVGTFITEGDIGVGTIVGSAVFNVLAVSACCGFAARAPLPLDWYPLTRDCVFYSFSVILLIFVLGNRQVFWYEAVVMVLSYSVYIIVMWKNDACRSFSERLVYRIRDCCKPKSKAFQEAEERSPLLHEEIVRSAEYSYGTSGDPFLDVPSSFDDKEASQKYDEMLIAKALSKNEEHALDEEEYYGICNFPREQSLLTKIEWICGWPARLVFTLTIPDCRKERFRKFYPLTFLMCIVYIALLTYVVAWMMTVIGHTLRIPDSVMGLTFIAAGTSVPEAVSSIIVARQGLGSMSISNSLGSNTFDILMCLGLPWLIRGALIANEEVNYIKINSGGLEFSTIILMISLILLYIIFAANGFYLDRKVAIIAAAMYATFLVVASLFELNTFFLVNLPACDISDLI